MNRVDIDRLGLAPGVTVTLRTASKDNVERKLSGLMVVTYNIPEGCWGATIPRPMSCCRCGTRGGQQNAGRDVHPGDGAQGKRLGRGAGDGSGTGGRSAGRFLCGTADGRGGHGGAAGCHCCAARHIVPVNGPR
jgi:hypothetical protein